jgi:hypothetical protein
MASKIVLPYEPASTAHREAQQSRRQTREWLARRERELAELLRSPRGHEPRLANSEERTG